MSDIVERLRDQGKDAFARKYSLGVYKLCAEAADEIERLRAALAATPAVGGERCPTCNMTDAGYSVYVEGWCRDPWHADDHLRAKVAGQPAFPLQARPNISNCDPDCADMTGSTFHGELSASPPEQPAADPD